MPIQIGYTEQMQWCFAKVNGRLAEVFFEREDGEREPQILGHSYVSPRGHTTKREQRLIDKDTVRYQLSYRKKIYRDKIRRKVLQRSVLPL